MVIIWVKPIKNKCQSQIGGLDYDSQIISQHKNNWKSFSCIDIVRTCDVVVADSHLQHLKSLHKTSEINS